MRTRGVLSRKNSSRSQIACSVMPGSVPSIAATIAGRRSSISRCPARDWAETRRAIGLQGAEQAVSSPALIMIGQGAIVDPQNILPSHIGLEGLVFWCFSDDSAPIPFMSDNRRDLLDTRRSRGVGRFAHHIVDESAARD